MKYIIGYLIILACQTSQADPTSQLENSSALSNSSRWKLVNLLVSKEDQKIIQDLKSKLETVSNKKTIEELDLEIERIKTNVNDHELVVHDRTYDTAKGKETRSERIIQLQMIPEATLQIAELHRQSVIFQNHLNISDFAKAQLKESMEEKSKDIATNKANYLDHTGQLSATETKIFTTILTRTAYAKISELEAMRELAISQKEKIKLVELFTKKLNELEQRISVRIANYLTQKPKLSESSGAACSRLFI